MTSEGHKQQQLIQLCQTLVRKPSPSGQERQIALLIREIMLSLDFDAAETDEMGNVIGHIRFPHPGKRLLFEAQMDHVPSGNPEAWKYFPHEAYLEGNRLYGRGTTDQKGSLAAMILAGATLKEHEEEFHGELLVAATVQQETFEGVASQFVARKCQPDFVVVNEATELEIERGQRGRAELVIETRGKMAHSAHPSLGINAASKMIRILGTLENTFVPQEPHFFGKGHLVLTNLISYLQPNTGAIPESCQAVLDRRMGEGETRETVLGQIEQVLNTLNMLDSDLVAHCYLSSTEERGYKGNLLRHDHFGPARSFPENHPFVQDALKGVVDAGISTRISQTAGYGNNGFAYALLGIPTVAFGPSRKELLHTVDEFVELDQLFGSFRGYWGIARKVLGKNS